MKMPSGLVIAKITQAQERFGTSHSPSYQNFSGFSRANSRYPNKRIQITMSKIFPSIRVSLLFQAFAAAKIEDPRWQRRTCGRNEKYDLMVSVRLAFRRSFLGSELRAFAYFK